MRLPKLEVGTYWVAYHSSGDFWIKIERIERGESLYGPIIVVQEPSVFLYNSSIHVYRKGWNLNVEAPKWTSVTPSAFNMLYTLAKSYGPEIT